MGAKQFANTHRQQKKWKEVERVLRWVYDILIGVEPDFDQAVLSMAELYRTALIEPESRNLGMDSIGWLWQERGLLPVYSQDMVGRYRAVREFLVVKAPNKMSNLADEDAFQFFQAAIRKGDQKGALITLSLVGSRPDLESNWRLLAGVAKQSWPDVTSALLELGADPNYVPTRRSYSLLFLAVRSGSALPAKGLLDAGADPNEGDDNYACPILFAAGVGDFLVVEALLQEPRTSSNMQDTEGRTSLALAAAHGHNK
ncbi:ankyrin repeat-containing domain protein [Aspergillus insuetus]